MSSFGRLQTRLFLSMLAGIALTVAVTGAVTWLIGREAQNRPTQILARSLAARLDVEWDDPPACDQSLQRMREDGFSLRLRRDVTALPNVVQRAAARGNPLATDPGEGMFVPIVHRGALVGAVEFDTSSFRSWRRRLLLVLLCAAVVVFGLLARLVARQLAQPLEKVAQAAERFGAGDLAARTDLAREPPGWVAEEVDGVARAFDTMAGRIEAIVRDERELLAAISHELRSPLGRARVALEIARDRTVAPVASPHLDQLERELAAVDAILGDLLAVNRAGLSDLRREMTALGPWLRARLAAEPSPPPVELAEAVEVSLAIDRPLLGRAVHNLVDNARVHGHPADLPLEVRLLREGSMARLCVRDRGPGFPDELLARAFEPFVRSDPARTPDRGGSGLGLALVRRIAEAHGGRAFARNVVEKGALTGAEVGIDLPLEDVPTV